LLKAPKKFFDALTKSERFNYVFDALLFTFVILAGRFTKVPGNIQGYGYLGALIFFLICFVYSQFKPRK
jgi:hypothetical protein